MTLGVTRHVSAAYQFRYLDLLCCSIPLPVRHRATFPIKKSAIPNPEYRPLNVARYSVLAEEYESTHQLADDTPNAIW